MTKANLLLLLAGVTLSACMPLSQAALVYSSSIQVGVKAAAASPGNPSPHLSVGYEQVDAAWVPVIVGRPCPEGESDCNETDYPLTTVLGRSVRDNSDKINGDALEARRREVERLGRAVSELEAQLEAARQRNRARNTESASLNQQSEGGPGESQPAIADPAARAARIAAIGQEVTVEEGNITTLNGQLDARRGELREAVLASEQLRSATDQTRTNNKVDALSVFGSFNGNVVAGANGPNATVNATLNLGRVFSTGVASQHLTEGFEQASRVSSVTQCLTAAAAAADGSPATGREETRRTLSLACTTGDAPHP